MCIFTCHYRTVVIGAFRNLQQPFPTCIFSAFFILSFGNTGIQVFLFHPGIKAADNIDSFRVRIAIHSLCSFIMYRTSRVKIMQPCRDSGEVRSITTLVSHAPHDDAWIILITLRHTNCTVHKCCMPVGGTCECSTQSVFFYIRFVHNIQSQAVA